jgi:hypothetical protein
MVLLLPLGRSTELAGVCASSRGIGPFTPEEVATLVANAFIGSEALLLLGFERPVMPIRSALRRIGVVIREREESADRTPPASGGAVVAG